jgi:hypothetical protein
VLNSQILLIKNHLKIPQNLTSPRDRNEVHDEIRRIHTGNVFNIELKNCYRHAHCLQEICDDVYDLGKYEWVGDVNLSLKPTTGLL